MQRSKEEDNPTRNQVEIFFIGGVIVILIGIFLFYNYRSTILKKNGVYVVGKVIDITNVENGYIATITYWFNEKKYKYKHKTLPAIKDTFVFLLISRDRPKICSLIKKPTVPQCIIEGRYRDSSWMSIPTCQ